MKRRLMTGVLCGVLILSSTMQSVRAEELNEPVISSSMESASDTGSSSSSGVSSDASEKNSGNTENYNASNNGADNSSNNASTETSAANSASIENDNAGNDASSQKKIATDLTQEIGGKSIRITTDPGVLPEGATLVVTDITNDSKVTDAIVDNTELTEQEISDVIAYDISIHDKNGEEIEPDASKGNVSVTMTDVEGAEEYNVYHVTDDCEKVDQVSAEKENDTVSFDTTHFSYFVLIKVSDITADTETTTIQLDEPLEIGKKYMITDLLTKAGYDYSKFAYVNMPDAIERDGYNYNDENKEVRICTTLTEGLNSNSNELIYYGPIKDSYIKINKEATCNIVFGLYDVDKKNVTKHNIILGITCVSNGTHQYQLGENIYADFNSNTGILNITGSGEMNTDYYGITSSDYDDANGPFSAIDIREVVIDENITSIGMNLFGGQKKLIKVTGNGIQKIGDGAFYKCLSLKTFNMPHLISIGVGAFYGCTDLDLTVLPSGVTSIGWSAFEGCTNLALTSLPAGIKSIDNSVFIRCENIALTSLPESLTSIGDAAFAGCRSLALTSLPASLTSIDYNAFWNCNNLNIVQCKGFTLTSDYTLPYTYVDSSGNEITVLKAGTTYDTVLTKMCKVSYYAVSSSGNTLKNTENVKNGETASWYKTFTLNGEKVEWYTDAALTVKADITAAISADTSFYCKDVMCTVKFYDGTTLLQTTEVTPGSSAYYWYNSGVWMTSSDAATADRADLSSVQKDMTVYAAPMSVMVNVYTEKGNFVTSSSAQWDGQPALIYENPDITWYSDKECTTIADLSHVKDNMAVYVKSQKCTIRYFDGDNLVNTVTCDMGSNAAYTYNDKNVWLSSNDLDKASVVNLYIVLTSKDVYLAPYYTVTYINATTGKTLKTEQVAWHCNGTLSNATQWYSDTACTSQVYLYSVTSDMTVYCKTSEFQVSFYSTDGSTLYETKTYNLGDKVYYSVDGNDVWTYSPGAQWSADLSQIFCNTSVYLAPMHTVTYMGTDGKEIHKDSVKMNKGSAWGDAYKIDGEPVSWYTALTGGIKAGLDYITADTTVYAVPAVAPTVTVSIPESIGLTITDGKITGSVDGILQSDIGTGYINTSPLGSWSLLAPSSLTLTNEDGKTISVGVTSSVTTQDAKDTAAGKRHTDNRYNLSAAEGKYAPGTYTGTLTFELQKTVN